MAEIMYNLTELIKIAQSGRETDVDELMRILSNNDNFIMQKMIDYALGLVANGTGRERIKHFLFHGNPLQRNYAALYFKRLGHREVLEEAVQQNCIDAVQAFSR